MMKLTELEERFRNVALIRGGVFLLSTADALRFVNACQRAGVRISGIEGFRVDGERIQPLQEHSVDYHQSQEGNHEDGAAFLISRHGEELWFEVVTEDREA